ncbi:MAG: ATP-binding protein [Chthoniobacter sp.]|nr:ATP-binding protein [Chthoniobacter sp.]
MTAIPNATITLTVPSATTLRTQNDMRLDDATVAEKIANYPPEIIEPVRWLAGYIRERCAGRLDLLVDHVKELGFSGKSKNYFYLVLTGRYFKPDGSVANLAQIIDKLRAGVVLSQRAGKMPFIPTGTYRSIADLLDTRRAPGAVCKWAVIIGPTGAQKTESAKHYCELENAKRFNSCIHTEAPEGVTLGSLLADLARRFGNSAWANANIQKGHIRASVNDRTLLLVDNAQRMYVPKASGQQPIFSFLQKLQDDSNCAVALMFAKDRANFLTRGEDNEFFEQIEGRAGGQKQFLTLDDFTPREDLIEIATAYELEGDLTANHSPEIAYLEKLSMERGRVRILFDALYRARMEADRLSKAENRKVALTLDLIRKVRGEVAK